MPSPSSDTARAERLDSDYRDELVTYAAKRVSEILAEDIVQEVFLKLLTYPNKIEQERSFLYTAVTREIVDRLRKEKKRRATSLRQECAGHDGDLGNMPADSRALPADVLASTSENIQLLLRAVGKLSKKDQRAVRMVYLDGMDYAEAGKKFGVSGEAIRKRVERALTKLQKMFPGA